MRKFLKWTLAVIACLGVVAALIGAGAYYIFSNSVFPANGRAELAGLSAPASVVRDRNGVPHIEAEGRREALQVLGYMHAADRLWQMEVLRMAGQGRLSELFGKPTINSDIFLKTLDLVTPSKASLSVVSEETRDLLQAYADGVNAYIKRKTGLFEPALAPEFMILGHQPEAWEAWHSVVILKIMALTLDSNMDEEIGRLALASKGFPPETIDEIYTYNDRDTPVPLPDLRFLYGYNEDGKLPLNTAMHERDKGNPANFSLPWPTGVNASNNWVVSGGRTETGKPLLANDPHLGFTAPSVFYLAHVKYSNAGKERNMIGGTLPGTPMFLAGRNDSLAWGLTTTNLDAQDLYIEEYNPQNRDEYRVGNEFAPFDVRTVTVKVKDGQDVKFTRRAGRHGPVLPQDYKDLERRLPHKTFAALRWTALDMDDKTIEGVMNIAEADDVPAFIEATRKIHSPMQSIVVADTDGNIALVAPGKVPLRAEENAIRGRAPVPGWLPQYEWQGYAPFEALPRIINPAKGALVTANAHWLPENSALHITYDWEEDFRQKRAEQLYLHSNRIQNLESVKAGMADMQSDAMLRFRNIALELLPQGAGIDEGIIREIRNWDGLMDRDAVSPIVLTAWSRHLNELMFRDDLGEDFDLVEKGGITRLLRILEEPSTRNWCNKQRSPKYESCTDIVSEALDLAVEELQNLLGMDWRSWRWGALHKSLHEHRPFTRVDALSKYFTIRREISGGFYTLLRSGNRFSQEEPYAATHGAAYRAVYDLSDLDNSRFIQSTGESGNIMSEHYDDLSDKWAALEYISMSTKPESYLADAKGTYVFTPGK